MSMCDCTCSNLCVISIYIYDRSYCQIWLSLVQNILSEQIHKIARFIVEL